MDILAQFSSGSGRVTVHQAIDILWVEPDSLRVDDAATPSDFEEVEIRLGQRDDEPAGTANLEETAKNAE